MKELLNIFSLGINILLAILYLIIIILLIKRLHSNDDSTS